MKYQCHRDKSNFISFVFHSFSNNDCHLLFKKLVDEKSDKVQFKNIQKLDEEYIALS